MGGGVCGGVGGVGGEEGVVQGGGGFGWVRWGFGGSCGREMLVASLFGGFGL